MNQDLIKHFKLSESDIAQIQAALLPDQTFLDVLFEKKLVDPVTYLAWAKEYYSLPVLKIEFLNQTNNVEALMDRYKSVFPKNVIPFHELDGVLYVMCLEPTPFEAPQTIQYILAPYEVISKYASKYESKVMTAPAPEAQEAQPSENTNPLFKDLEISKNPLESFNFESLTSGVDTKTAEGDVSDIGNIQLEDKVDVPAGMDFPPAPTDNESFASNVPVSSVDLNSFSFAGIMPADDAQKETPQAPVVETAPPTQAVTATPEAPVIIKPKPVKIDTSKPLTPATASSLAAKHPPKPKVAEPQAASAAPTPVAPVIEPNPTPQVIPPMAPPLEMPSFLSKAASPIASEAPQFDGILQSMKKYFDQSMVLIFNNGNLEPVAWDSTWIKVVHSQAAIDISNPSIFRIVNETLHAYHGYVVANPINESFFGNWNRGQYPEHVTICPIFEGKKIYGMILGAATKEAAKKYQLHHVQEIANDAHTLLNSSKAA